MEALPRRKNKLSRRVINPSTQFTGDYQVLTGWTNQQSGDNIFISAFNATGDLLTAAYLGAAPWAGLTDSAHVLNTAIMNGLDAQRVMKTYWKGYNPLNKGDREFMKQHGFSSHMLSSHLSNQVRMFGEISGNNLPSWLATSLNTASGLAWQTELGKFAVASDMGATLGDLAVKKTAWRDVDPAFKELLESHGMNEKHWDAVLNSNQHMYDDSIRVDPHDIAATIREATPEELNVRSSELKQLNDEKIADQTERLEQASLAIDLVGESDRLNKLSSSLDSKIQRMEVKQAEQKGRLAVASIGERDAMRKLFSNSFSAIEQEFKSDIRKLGFNDAKRAASSKNKINDIIKKKEITENDLSKIDSEISELEKISNKAKSDFKITNTSKSGIKSQLEKKQELANAKAKKTKSEKVKEQQKNIADRAKLASLIIDELDNLKKSSDKVRKSIQSLSRQEAKQSGIKEASIAGERDAYKALFGRIFRDTENKLKRDISDIGVKDRIRAKKARDKIESIINKKHETIEDLKEIKSQLKEFTKILNAAKKKFKIKKTSSKGIRDELQKVITQSQERIQSLRNTDIQAKAASELKAENMQNALNASNIIADAMSELASKGANEATVRVRAYATGAAYGIDARKGTVGRAAARTAFMFKSFPMTVMVNHVMPALKMAAPALRGDFSQARFSPLIRLMVLNTMLGGFFLQAKQLITGKDLYDMETWQFWSRAMLFGGGMGIMGDFMFQSYKGTGSKLTETLAGPVVGFYSDAAKVFKGNLDGVLEDQSDNALEKFRRDLFRFVKKNTPFNNLWYTQMFTNRWLFDQMESFVDPNYEKRMDDLEDAYLRSTGQGYWWKPGQALPSRAPQFGERRR